MRERVVGVERKSLEAGARPGVMGANVSDYRDVHRRLGPFIRSWRASNRQRARLRPQQQRLRTQGREQGQRREQGQGQEQGRFQGRGRSTSAADPVVGSVHPVNSVHSHTTFFESPP